MQYDAQNTKDYVLSWNLENIFTDLINSISILKPNNPLQYSVDYMSDLIQKSDENDVHHIKSYNKTLKDEN